METTLRTDIIDEGYLLSNISSMIEKRKFSLVTTANSHLIFMFWEIGRYINQAILEDDRGWDLAFKKTIANGNEPENDMFEGMKDE